MTYTLDTPLGTLLDHPQAKEIMDQYLPGLSTNPLLGMFKGLTLNKILSMPQAAQLGLTEEKVEALLAEVNQRVA